jgi:ribulose 1,5-bisphosphate synthetase/thiazole synthase
VGAFIAEPARRTPDYGEFDVVVVGGGPAGEVLRGGRGLLPAGRRLTG